jgi:thiamine biosynthesis lipoprotein
LVCRQKISLSMISEVKRNKIIQAVKWGSSILPLLLFAFCSSPNTTLYEFNGEAQGTYYTIKYLSNEDTPPFTTSYFDRLFESIDSSLSTYKPYSIITSFNQSDSIVTDDPWFMEMIKQSDRVVKETDGYFDPSVKHLVSAYGFGPEGRRIKEGLNLDSILAITGWDKLDIHFDDQGRLTLKKKVKGIQIGFNAIAQGYASDIIADSLDQYDINNYLIDAGGELRAKGVNHKGNPWNIGIDKPLPLKDPREILAVLPLKDKSIATSGSYRKYYEVDGVKYSHAISPISGKPVSHSLLSVTVIADECSLADAYSTAILVMGIEKGKEFLENRSDLEAFLVYENTEGELETYQTAGMEKRIKNSE